MSNFERELSFFISYLSLDRVQQKTLLNVFTEGQYKAVREIALNILECELIPDEESARMLKQQRGKMIALAEGDITQSKLHKHFSLILKLIQVAVYEDEGGHKIHPDPC